MQKIATGVVLMDFLFQQCEEMSIAEIQAKLIDRGTPLSRNTIDAHVKTIVGEYPDRVCIKNTFHQYRRLPVKKYIFYPDQKRCN